MKKKLSKISNTTGIFLDADFERLITIDLPLVKSDQRSFGEFAFVGDMHYGNKDFSESVMHGYLQYFKDHPNIQIGLMGDIVEYGEGSSFIKEEKVPIDEQIAQFVADFKGLKDRIKFILWGNHEERYVRISSARNFMRVLALELGINPDDGKCFIGEPQRGIFAVFKAGEKSYGAYVQHSKTNARINQDIQLARAGSQNLVALLVHGHTHRLLWKPRTFRAIEEFNGQFVNVVRRQYLLATGCFLKYPSYAEANSMPYTEVGSPIVKFYSDNNEVGEYDLTNKYRDYLTRGGISYGHAQIDLNSIKKHFEKKKSLGVIEKCLSEK